MNDYKLSLNRMNLCFINVFGVVRWQDRARPANLLFNRHSMYSGVYQVHTIHIEEVSFVCVRCQRNWKNWLLWNEQSHFTQLLLLYCWFERKKIQFVIYQNHLKDRNHKKYILAIMPLYNVHVSTLCFLFLLRSKN